MACHARRAWRAQPATEGIAHRGEQQHRRDSHGDLGDFPPLLASLTFTPLSPKFQSRPWNFLQVLTGWVRNHFTHPVNTIIFMAVMSRNAESIRNNWVVFTQLKWSGYSTSCSPLFGWSFLWWINEWVVVGCYAILYPLQPEFIHHKKRSSLFINIHGIRRRCIVA